MSFHSGEISDLQLNSMDATGKKSKQNLNTMDATGKK